MFALFWLVLTVGGLKSWLTDDAPDHPDAIRAFPLNYLSDFEYFVAFPGLVFLVNLLLVLAALRVPKWVALSLFLLQCFFVVAFLLFNTGGV